MQRVDTTGEGSVSAATSPKPEDETSILEHARSERSSLPRACLPLTRNGFAQLEIITRFVDEAMRDLLLQASTQHNVIELEESAIRPIRERLTALQIKLRGASAEDQTRNWADELISWSHRVQQVRERRARLGVLLQTVTITDADAETLRHSDIGDDFADALRRAHQIWLRLERLPADMQSWKLISDARKRVQRVIEAALERVRAWVHTLDWTEDESPTRGPVSAILKIVQFWPQVRTECLEQIVQGRQRVLLQELQQQWDVDVRAASRRKNSLPTEDRLRLINDLLALVHQRLELECERWAQVFGTKRAKMAESSELAVINQDETNASDMVAALVRQSSEIYADAIDQRLRPWFEDNALPLVAMHRLERLLLFYKQLLERILGSDAVLVVALDACRSSVFERCLSRWRDHLSPLYTNELPIPRDLSTPPLLIHEAKQMRSCLDILRERTLCDATQQTTSATLTDLFLEALLAAIFKPTIQKLEAFARCVLLMNVFDSLNEILAPFWTEAQRERLAQGAQQQRATYTDLAVARSLRRCRLGTLTTLRGDPGRAYRTQSTPTDVARSPETELRQHEEQRPSLEAVAISMRAFETLLFEAPDKDWFIPPLVSRIANRSIRKVILDAQARALANTYHQIISSITESGAYSVPEITLLHLRDTHTVDEALFSLAKDVAIRLS